MASYLRSGERSRKRRLSPWSKLAAKLDRLALLPLKFIKFSYLRQQAKHGSVPARVPE